VFQSLSFIDGALLQIETDIMGLTVEKNKIQTKLGSFEGMLKIPLYALIPNEFVMSHFVPLCKMTQLSREMLPADKIFNFSDVK
jgi:hypothetical protein